MLGLFKRDKTIYSCGNCQQTFKTHEQVLEHHRQGCPQVAMLREVAEWNRSAYATLREKYPEHFS